MTTLHLRNSIGRSPLRRGFVLIPLVLLCFALLRAPNAFGVSPAPDGGYLGGNTAEGHDALFSLTNGVKNTAVGFDVLYYNTSGSNNTANGFSSLLRNTIGSYNTAEGVRALRNNTGGYYNTANGYEALLSNTTGHDNTADGAGALRFNSSGGANTAIGSGALYNITFGHDNTAIGGGALLLLAGGSGNIALGAGAGDSLRLSDNNIFIGNEGDFFDYSNTIRIGTSQTRTFVAGIRGVTTGNAGAIPVVIDSAGQLGTTSSSRRFKKEIKPMDQTSETILALKPVTFHYKSDSTCTPQFGLIAEEVAKVNPDLVVRDGEGRIYTVRYEAVNAMLLNEFLKEHRKVTQLETTVVQQGKDFQVTTAQQRKEFESKIALQQKQIEALTAGLQKVSAQLETNKPAPQLVSSHQ